MGLGRWLVNRGAAPGDAVVAERRPMRVAACQLCGTSLADGSVSTLVADPTVIRPDDPLLDGLRLLTACTSSHLAALTAQHQATVR